MFLSFLGSFSGQYRFRISVFSLIFIERKDPTTTWAWLLILLLIPGVGFIVYLLLGQNLSRQKIFR